MTKPNFINTAAKLITPNQTRDENIKATEIFLEEKQKELNTSSQARSWEKGRKEEWAENKPYYLKSKQKEDPTKKILDDIYHGGRFKSLTPAPNLLLVLVDEEETTSGGIILTSEVKAPNTGLVIDTAPQAYLPNGNVTEMPYCRGDHILYRKFSGMEVEINGKKLLMLTFQDILGLIGI